MTRTCTSGSSGVLTWASHCAHLGGHDEADDVGYDHGRTVDRVLRLQRFFPRSLVGEMIARTAMVLKGHNRPTGER
jgi:hypothetical protein